MPEENVPKPHIAKALVVTAPLVALFGWFIAGRFRIPAPYAIPVFIGAWIAVSATVHARVKNDWRTRFGDALSMSEVPKQP